MQNCVDSLTEALAAQPFGAKLKKSVEIEYNGKVVDIELEKNAHWNKANLFGFYTKLAKTFDISPERTMITGFIYNPAGGGPICPFRLFENLRGDILIFVASRLIFVQLLNL